MMKKLISFVKFYWIGILIALTFFTIGMATLSHYGNNIDESIHFERGNAYLDFFLTGRQKYTTADFEGPRVSEWKYKGFDTAWFIKNDNGHPPLNGILAAITNRIFYTNLGIMGDLESYHMFELFVSGMLVFLIFTMVRSRYGLFAGTIASLSIALYPLFYGESHFNIKDPVEATFFAFTVYFLYLGIERVKGRYFFISSLFCALAFGTKFNIVFLPFIIIPYFFIRRGIPFILERGKLGKLKKIPKSIYLALFFYPLIVIGIHFITRPFLWPDPLNRFMQIVQYYRDIGTGIDYQSKFIKYGFNTYPAFFIGISTPLVIITYFLIGVFACLSRLKQEKDKFSLLILLWFGVTVLRVSLPGSSIYGGVRQIMEYIPAMAVITGVGAFYFRNLLSKFINIKIASLIILFSFVPLIITLVGLHPNENLFMNSLIGGLKGATEKKITGAGETMGNAYLQGILWLNDHAEKNARFGFPEGLGSNFPPQFLRKDIKFGAVFSGEKRSGEYMMEMFSVDFPFPRYHYDYLSKFIDPIYVRYVGGVPILKIWKNDAAHTKPGFMDEVQESNIIVSGGVKEGLIQIEFKDLASITRIEIEHDRSACLDEGSGNVSYTSSDGREFLLPDDLYRSQALYALSLQTQTHFVYFLTAQKAKKITITPYDANLCLLQVRSAKVFRLKNLISN